MGNSQSIGQILGEELLEDYLDLTYLSKGEIHRIYNRIDTVEPGKLRKNIHHRFSAEQVEQILPEIRYNPFRHSIYRVFSSESDGCLSFEDILDLCSAFAENCPETVRAAWAFKIFDFDGDNQVSLSDLVEAVQRLTRLDQDTHQEIHTLDAERVARMILKEMDLTQMGSISSDEFVHLVVRMPDFAHTFRFKV